jgi:hypothetical protein
MHQSRRRWAQLLVMAAGVALLIGLLAPVGRRALASVTLNYFRATWVPDAETIVIEWQTATELNTTGFIVERSTSPDAGFTAITDIIPAVGDQLAGWTYDPVADDPTNLVLGTTYWYRLIVINTSPPNDVFGPVGVNAGEPNTLTPTHTATATATNTATSTRTRTPTPTATATTSPARQATSSVPGVTPTVTFVSISGATVTPRPVPPLGATAGIAPATIAPVSTAAIRTVTPINRSTVTPALAAVSPIGTPVAAAQATSAPPTVRVPTAVLPTLVPTNATFVAVAPIVVAGEATTPTEAAPADANLSILVLIGTAGVLLLGGVYAILRQTLK